MKINKKVVLITGAAHGLGQAMARKFLAAGYTVVATDKDDLSMAWMTDHPGAGVYNMDVTSDESVQRVFSALEAKAVTIDLLVNNAGMDAYFPLSEAPVNMFRQIFEVNVFGAYRVNQVFMPLLRKPGGRIIIIGSESLNLTVPFMPYPLTKKLLEGYARALRIELRFSGVDVLTVRPGAIKTRLLETVSDIDPGKGRWRLEKQFRKFTSAATTEIGKTITPQQAADFVYAVSRIPNPKAVYRINNMVKLRLMALLPLWFAERLIYRKLLEQHPAKPKG